MSASSLTLATALADEYARQTRSELMRARKFATGKTVKATRGQGLGGSRAAFRSKVTSSRSILYIAAGRRAGAKMPVKVVGQTKGGKSAFGPVDGLLEWFLALSIPRRLWFVIARSIARRGIRPLDIQKLAYKASQPRWRKLMRDAGRDIAVRLFTR
jgi:hypothetical protein